MALGRYTCAGCGKRDWQTRFAARAEVLRVLYEEDEFLDEYRCPRGGGWHVTSLIKKLRKFSADHHYPGLDAGPKIELLRELQERGKPAVEPRKDHDLAARRKSDRRKLDHLAAELRSVPRKRCARRDVRSRSFQRSQRYRWPRDTTRAGLPRGELMTRMLAWPNAKLWGIEPSDVPRSWVPALRRRNRRRENEAVRRDILNELGFTRGRHANVVIFDEVCDYWQHCEYHPDARSQLSTQMWRVEAEEDDGMRFVDILPFTTESENDSVYVAARDDHEAARGAS